MKFKEFDTVRLISNDEKEVKKGDIGAILMVFDKPNEAYEVEFLDENGYPKAQCTLYPDDLELA
jgi:hypothetical protein